MKKIKLIPSFLLLTLATPVISSCSCDPTISVYVKTIKDGNSYKSETYISMNNTFYEIKDSNFNNIKTETGNKKLTITTTTTSSTIIQYKTIIVKVGGKKLQAESSTQSNIRVYNIPSDIKVGSEIEISLEYEKNYMCTTVVTIE